MRNRKSHTQLFFGIYLLFCAISCTTTRVSEAKFELDHIVIFVTDTQLEDLLRHGPLTYGDKLATKHLNQGTLGHYYIFYNTFIEFLYLENATLARNNQKLFKSNYSERWSTNDTICPFGFGLTMTPFDTSLTSFPLSTYYSLDLSKEEYYLMSEYNNDHSQPLIYVSAPNKAYNKLDTLSQLDDMFEDPVRNDFRTYLTHPAGIKQLTKTVVTLPKGVKGGNLELIQKLKEIEIKWGTSYALTLVFDHEIQGREISLNGNFNLKIKY